MKKLLLILFILLCSCTRTIKIKECYMDCASCAQYEAFKRGYTSYEVISNKDECKVKLNK